jgi:hypothetical protein
MATTAALPSTETSNTLAVPLSTENVEYRVYVKLDKEGSPVREKDKDGKPGEVIREVKLATQKDPNFAKYEAANDKTADPADGTKMEWEAGQTIAKPKFGSIEAFEKYFDDDPELAMYIVNLGVNSRFSTVVPKALGDTVEDGTLKFPFSETVFDPRELLTAEIQRRNLSPVEKATRDLKKLTASGVSAADLIAMLQALQASQS